MVIVQSDLSVLSACHATSVMNVQGTAIATRKGSVNVKDPQNATVNAIGTGTETRETGISHEEGLQVMEGGAVAEGRTRGLKPHKMVVIVL